MVSILFIAVIGGISHFDFSSSLPSHFPSPIYDFSNNPLSPEKIELGRALFYDPILSADNSISCASCHSPYNGFAHTDHSLSHGINDSIGRRNAPALFNLAWATSFNWDGAVNHLDMQALAPIEDHKEMNMIFAELISKLNESSLYPNLYFNAFEDSLITGENSLKALAAFQLTLISQNSKYDQKIKGEVDFTEIEIRGEQLFLKYCNTCHTAPLFTNYSFQNNGLTIDQSLHDYGRLEVTGSSGDSLKFKVPSLRNLSYTYPYMHDGRFSTLREILNHYSQGIQTSVTSPTNLKEPLELNDDELTELTAFLLTLNDPDFISDPSNKFPRNTLLKD
ncbi:MAG: cytochrome-c peroxidase [Flavobacteriales bacterium]